MAHTWLRKDWFPYSVLITLENTDDFKEYMKNDHSYQWVSHETKLDVFTACTLFMFKDEKWAIDAEREFKGIRMVAETDKPRHAVNVCLQDHFMMQDWIMSRYMRSMYDVRYDMDRPHDWPIWFYFHDDELAVEFKIYWSDYLQPKSRAEALKAK